MIGVLKSDLSLHVFFYFRLNTKKYDTLKCDRVKTNFKCYWLGATQSETLMILE